MASGDLSPKACGDSSAVTDVSKKWFVEGDYSGFNMSCEVPHIAHYDFFNDNGKFIKSRKLGMLSSYSSPNCR